MTMKDSTKVTVKKKIVKKEKKPKSSSKGKEGKEAGESSWELAVEKARGMPDGVAIVEDMEVDEEVKEEKITEVKTYDTQKTEKNGKKRKNSDKKDEKKINFEDMEPKERKKARRMLKDNYELSTQAKEIWEKLRKHNLTNEKRNELCNKLYDLVKGKEHDIIYAHDTSRVIQCLIKSGDAKLRHEVFNELKSHLLEMMKSKYAKFTIRKLLKYGSKSERDCVFKSMYGQIKKLIRHKEAAPILEMAYNVYANSAQRFCMMEEFYGPRFALFKTHQKSRTLNDIMKETDDKESVLKYIRESLSTLIDRNMVQFTIVHRLFLDYMTFASDRQRSDMIEIVRECLVHMLHTHDGAHVAMLCIWHGTAKDRKMIVKSFKTFISKIACEEYGHLVLMSLFDVVDDTKLVTKAILDELLKSCSDLFEDIHGRKIIYYLLGGREKSHFHPDILKIIARGDENVTSKKNKSIRYKELLDHVSAPLVTYVSKNAESIVKDSQQILLLVSAITHVTGDTTEAMKAVAEVAGTPIEDEDTEHIVTSPYGHIAIKKLILNDVEKRKTNPDATQFSEILLDTVGMDSLKNFAASNRGCFLLVCLIENGKPEILKRIKKSLTPIMSSLKKLEFKGAEILLKKLT